MLKRADNTISELNIKIGHIDKLMVTFIGFMYVSCIYLILQ